MGQQPLALTVSFRPQPEPTPSPALWQLSRQDARPRLRHNRPAFVFRTVWGAAPGRISRSFGAVPAFINLRKDYGTRCGCTSPDLLAPKPPGILLDAAGRLRTTNSLPKKPLRLSQHRIAALLNNRSQPILAPSGTNDFNAGKMSEFQFDGEL